MEQNATLEDVINVFSDEDKQFNRRMIGDGKGKRQILAQSLVTHQQQSSKTNSFDDYLSNIQKILDNY